MSVSVVRGLSGRVLSCCRTVCGGGGGSVLSRGGVTRGWAGGTRGSWAVRAAGSPRSLWLLTRPHVDHTQSHAVTGPWNKTCGCCSLHTAGDKELADFLEEEIQLEQKSDKTPGKLPKVQGFDITTDGTEVTLTKKGDQETVSVKFNVNNTVEDEEVPDEANPEAEAPVKMISRPPFIVDIVKGDTTLTLTCSFPDGDPVQEEEYDDDVILIQEVALFKGEYKDTDYTMSASVMDGTLYDLLLNMIEERGVTAEVIDQIVEFSTSYEHKKYIGFLQQLRGFVGGN